MFVYLCCFNVVLMYYFLLFQVLMLSSVSVLRFHLMAMGLRVWISMLTRLFVLLRLLVKLVELVLLLSVLSVTHLVDVLWQLLLLLLGV